MEDSRSRASPTESNVKMEDAEEEHREEIREVNVESEETQKSKLATDATTDAGPATQEAANPSVAIDPTIVMLEQLSTALGVLKSHTESSLAMQNSVQWEEIQSHFKKLDASLNARAEELDCKKAELEEKQARAQMLIKEKEAAIKEKERESWNRLQVVKDEAVSRIREACEKHKVDASELIYGRNRRPKAVAKYPEESTPAIFNFNPLPALKQLFERMDSKGIVQFFLENHRKLSVLTEELVTALRCAPDPARLVLDLLEEGFWYQAEAQAVQDDGENALTCIRKCCITLMELLTSGAHTVSQEVSARAWAMLAGWKQTLAGMDLDVLHNGCSMEAQAVLQLMVTFNVTSVYDEDELSKLAVAISRRKQTAELCRAVGLTERIPGIVEELISRKRPIDAVHFIQAFGLGEKFPVVSILMSHLEELQDVWEYDTEKNLSQKDPNAKEIVALRTVIRVAEEYKLQKEFAIGPLQKRIAELRGRPVKRVTTDPPYPRPPKKRGPMYPNSTYPPAAPRPGPPAVDGAVYAADPYTQYPVPPASSGYTTAYPQYPPPADTSTSTPHYSSAPTYYGSYAGPGPGQDPYSGYGGYVDPSQAQVQVQAQGPPAVASNYGSYSSSGYPAPAQQSYM